MNENYDSRTPHGDLIVKPHQYVYILDETKGQISVIVGPQKMSMAGTDKTVKFNPDTSGFDLSSPFDALEQFITSPTGSYVVLSNPAQGEKKHPSSGVINSFTDLNYGSKLNLAGPVFFPLWPGQLATVIEGHNLRSNQYLICRVYDDEEAKANIADTVVKKQIVIDDGTDGTGNIDTDIVDDAEILQQSQIVTGKLFIIKGTEISFYIPPTGIEVLSDSNGQYTRDAVTIEQLEYCVLLSENGGKRFERGPQVVFPLPTERFVSAASLNGNRSRSFRAMELNDISGVHIKIIADYDDGDVEHKEGEELFITGKEQRIYYPRFEHSIIEHGNTNIHYAVAIPVGDAKYVLDRTTGEIQLISGPTMFLADPRKEVIVRRILSNDHAMLWYPNNSTVVAHNEQLSSSATSNTDKFVTEKQYSASMAFTDNPSTGDYGALSRTSFYSDTSVFAKGQANEITSPRSAKFTKPEQITIDNKYDGAVKIRVWPGYAVQIVNGIGDRSIKTGPCVIQLGYDSELESFILSKGKPKTTSNIMTDVYLRINNNRITDIVELETQDMISVSVTLSYRVDFTGDADKWFNIENYVQYLTDRMISMLRTTASEYKIGDFYDNYSDIIRDCVLGPMQTDDDVDSRPGITFSENGMHINEVEVLNLNINDNQIRQELVTSQLLLTRGTIRVANLADQLIIDTQHAELDERVDELTLANRQRSEELERNITKECALTREVSDLDNLEKCQSSHELDLVLAQFDADTKKLKTDSAMQEVTDRDEFNLNRQDALDEIEARTLERKKSNDEHATNELKLMTIDYVTRLTAEAENEVKVNGAVAPGLIEALHALAQSGTIEKLAAGLAPLSIVKGMSLGNTITEMFAGTQYADTIKSLTSRASQPSKVE